MDYTTSAITGMVVSLIFYAGSRLSKPDRAFKSKPKGLTTFSTSASKAEVFAAVRRYANYENLTIEEAHSTEESMIMGQDKAFSHNGFWLVVYANERPGFPTFVEVGIKSKTMQAFGLEKYRKKLVMELKSMLPVR